MARVTVELNAIDRLSPVMRGLGGLIDNVFSVATNAVQGFGRSLQEAAANQADIVKSVGSLASTANMAFGEADSLTQDITESLAKYAAALPGTTNDYVQLFRSISDDVAGINQEMNGGTLNIEQYSDQVSALSAKFKALGSDLPFNQVLLPLQKMLAGGSIAQLQRLKFFQVNPVLLTRLQETMEAMGAVDLGELSRGDRLNVTLKALDLTLTDDTIARLNNTIDAQTQSFMTTVFDPTVGIFGLMRDLDRKTKGVQSALGQITNLWTAIVGSDGIIFTFANLLQSMGVDLADPMQVLSDRAQWLTTQIRKVAATMNVAANYFESGAGELGFQTLKNLIPRFFSGIQGFTDNLGERLANLFNGAIAFIRSLDLNQIASSVAEIGASIVNQVVLFVNNIDYGALAALIPQIGIALGAGILSAIASLNYGQMLGIAAVAIGSQLVSLAIPVMMSQLVVPLIQLFASGLGISLAGFPALAIAAIALIVASLIGTVRKHWNTISDTFSSLINAFGSAMSGVFKIIGGILTGNIPMIRSGLQDIFNSFKSLFDFIQRTVDGFKANFGIQTSGEVAAASSVAAADQKFLEAAQRAGTTRALGTEGNPLPPIGGSRASGNLKPLLEAVRSEGRSMPSGSSVVIANSSEAILNRSQLGAIGGLHIESIILNSSAHLSPQLVNEIFGAIEDRWKQAQQKAAIVG